MVLLGSINGPHRERNRLDSPIRCVLPPLRLSPALITLLIPHPLPFSIQPWPSRTCSRSFRQQRRVVSQTKRRRSSRTKQPKWSVLSPPSFCHLTNPLPPLQGLHALFKVRTRPSPPPPFFLPTNPTTPPPTGCETRSPIRHPRSLRPTPRRGRPRCGPPQEGRRHGPPGSCIRERQEG